MTEQTKNLLTKTDSFTVIDYGKYCNYQIIGININKREVVWPFQPILRAGGLYSKPNGFVDIKNLTINKDYYRFVGNDLELIKKGVGTKTIRQIVGNGHEVLSLYCFKETGLFEYLQLISNHPRGDECFGEWILGKITTDNKTVLAEDKMAEKLPSKTDLLKTILSSNDIDEIKKIDIIKLMVN